MTAEKADEFNPRIIDMEEEMVEEAKKKIKEAINELSDEKEMAHRIKNHFDTKYGKIWHCVVGKSFGAFGTHETRHFLYIYYKNYAIQLWKCGYIYESKGKEKPQ